MSSVWALIVGFLGVFLTLYCLALLAKLLMRAYRHKQAVARGTLQRRSPARAPAVRPRPRQASAWFNRRFHQGLDPELLAEAKLRNKLIKLLRGNNDAAERLVDSARRQKPFMGDVWYLEKVIADLERDRRR